MWKYLVFLLLVCNYIESVTSLSCGPAPTIRNADLTSSGTSFNDTVVYTCQPGYTINGGNARRCTAMGKWSGVGPTCLRVCKQPDLPFGAYVRTNVKSEYKTGESIMLDCKKGFKKIGKPRKICISGRWTAFPFECKATHFCTRTIRASRTRCTAKCSPNDPAGCPAGHKCLCDGQCGYSCIEQGLQCRPPSQVKNGIIAFTTTGYNDTVMYRCLEKFTLNGDRVRRCTAKKRWEGAVPSCLPDCGQPKVPLNAYIKNNKSKYASGDRVTFKCVKGYTQEGIATTLCFMGKWNVMPFICEKGGCGDPGTPENGNKVGVSNAPGREVFFSCNIGYVRVGSEQRRCLPNNTWSGTQPTCELIDCGPPKQLKYGTIIGSETTFQESISFRCDDGFKLDGNPSAICQSDRKWSAKQPTCKRLSCGPAPTIRNADLTSSGTQFNDTVVYTCQPDYTINGDNARRCTGMGKWSGVGPTCLRVCDQPDLPFGAYVKTNVKSRYKTGESIMLDCKKGFKKIGKPRRICISGRWTAFPFECQATHCSKRTIRSSRTRCTAKCSPNDPAGCPAGHRCLCDGQCGYSCVEQGLQCPRPRQVKNGIISFESTGYNDTVMYRCKENFTLNGDRVRRCTAKKRWEGPVPSCLPDCGQPRVPLHAYIQNKKSKYASGDRVTFKCVAGFNEDGIATTLCFMGKWNVMPFRCETLSCSRPTPPDNAYIYTGRRQLKEKYGFNEVVMFRCKEGYRVSFVRCLTNGWGKTNLRCPRL